MHRKTTARTLTSRERKEIDAAVRRARGAERKQPATAQDSIPYQRMWPDGVCRVSDTFYSKTVRFEDINYQLAQNEDKTAIFEGWCDFLNYFDASIRFQFSFHNLYGGHDALEQSIVVPPRGDDFDEIRREYTEMLQTQLAKGNNGLKKTRYITFGIEDTLKNGSGYTPESSLPGDDGMSVILGHRNRNHLKIIEDVQVGDEISFCYLDGRTISYSVTDVQIFENSADWVLPQPDGNMLVIVTCYPFRYSGNAPGSLYWCADTNSD